MCAFVCFCKFLFFHFLPLGSVQSVCECLICSLCWLLFVKHTFNSSILYCICFPFFLFVSISRAHARVSVLYLVEFSTNGALPPQIHARTCLPSRRVSIGSPNRCAIDVLVFIISLSTAVNVQLGCLEWSTCDNWLKFNPVYQFKGLKNQILKSSLFVKFGEIFMIF